MSQIYCAACGSKIEYILTKPVICPKCKKPLAGAFKAKVVKPIPQVAPESSSNIDELVAKLVNEKLAQMLGNNSPSNASQSKSSIPTRARKKTLVKDDNGEEYWEEEGMDQYNEEQAKQDAQEIVASLGNVSSLFEPIGTNPNKVKFKDLVPESDQGNNNDSTNGNSG